MRFRLFALAIVLPLAACAKPELPAVIAAGPSFDGSRFDCGARPLPPDPAAVGVKCGSAAARYEERLGSWAQSCDNKLGSVGIELAAAGQVVTPAAATKGK